LKGNVPRDTMPLDSIELDVISRLVYNTIALFDIYIH